MTHAKRISLAVAAALLFLGCPKRTEVNVAGSDDEQVDQLSAKLEELHTSTQSVEMKCEQFCTYAKQVTPLAERMCEIAGRNTDRQDMQRKCVSAQEEQARLNDGCAPCR